MANFDRENNDRLWKRFVDEGRYKGLSPEMWRAAHDMFEAMLAITEPDSDHGIAYRISFVFAAAQSDRFDFADELCDRFIKESDPKAAQHSVTKQTMTWARGKVQELREAAQKAKN